MEKGSPYSRPTSRNWRNTIKGPGTKEEPTGRKTVVVRGKETLWRGVV